MKKELSTPVIAIIVVAVVAVVGGVGYMWFGKATGSAAVSKADEQKAYEQAKNYYSDIGSKSPGASRPGGNAEYEARMKSTTGQ